MKRLCRYFAISFLIALCVFALSSCKHEHVFGEWSYAKLPTCTEEGLQSRICSGCDVTEERAVAALGHDETLHERKEPTCTEKGNRAYVTCSRCDYTTYEELEPVGHVRIPHAAKAATCTENGNKAYFTCAKCDFTTIEVIEALGHDIVKYEGKEVTCTTDGWEPYEVCKRCDLNTKSVIKAKGHKAAVVEAVAPTCTESGLSTGRYCSVCNVVILAQNEIEPLGHKCQKGFCTVCGIEDYIEPTQYGSRVMYNTLASYQNGKDMQKLYSMIEEAAKKFHYDYTTDLALVESGGWADIAERIDCKSLSLTYEDGYVVCSAFIRDNPIYYWLCWPTLYYNGNTHKLNNVKLRVANGYEKGSTREFINGQLARELKKYAEYAKGETSAYQIALCYYEQVILNTAYETAAVGADVKNFRSCRNILGTFIYGRAVCVGYSLAFNTLLNFYGVECSTISGANHQWSIVRMDDGEWYWFDPTWDDRPNMPYGFETHYFCVNDTQPTDWLDASAPGSSGTLGNKGFISDHPPYQVGDEEESRYEWSYGLPERSSVKFSDPDVLELRETFTVDQKTYALVGYRKVQLVSAVISTTFEVPEKVVYNGVEYTVVSVGAIMSSGLFDGTKSIGNGYAKNVILPSTIERVFPRALTSENTAVNFFYMGTAAELKEMYFASKYLAKSKIYFYSETRPTTSGNYWRYVNGTPKAW